MKKRNNEKGFTLAELLVVVAIIGVLVAVSIPIFRGKLEQSRETTDVANMRAAKAAAVTQYLADEKKGTYYYDAENGKLVEANTGIKPYGKGTAADGKVADFMGYKGEANEKGNVVGKIIKVTISDSDEIIKMVWEKTVK